METLPNIPHKEEFELPKKESEELQNTNEAQSSTEIKKPSEVYNSELLDSKGKAIGLCEVEVEILPSTVESMPWLAQRDVKRMTIKSLDGREFDLVRRCCPEGVKIMSAISYNYFYYPDNKTVTCPPSDNPVNIGILLHELGHANQYTEDRFQKLAPFYNAGEILTPEKLEQLVNEIPQIRDMISDEDLELYKKSIQKIKNIQQSKADLIADAERSVLTEQISLREAYDSVMKDTGIADKVQNLIDDIGKEWSERVKPNATAEEMTNIWMEISKKATDTCEAMGFEFDDSPPANSDDPHYEPPAERYSPRKLKKYEVPYQIGSLALSLNDHPYLKDVHESREGDEIVILTTFTVSINGHPKDVINKLRISAESDAVRSLEKCQSDLWEVKDTLAFTKNQLEEEEQKIRTEAGDIFDRVREAMRLPQRMMERDATRRALQWMHDIRLETGVDLIGSSAEEAKNLVATGMQPSVNVPFGACVEDAVAALQKALRENAIEASTAGPQLKKALGSYGANTKQMRSTYGKIPRA